MKLCVWNGLLSEVCADIVQIGMPDKTCLLSDSGIHLYSKALVQVCLLLSLSSTFELDFSITTADKECLKVKVKA